MADVHDTVQMKLRTDLSDSPVKGFWDPRVRAIYSAVECSTKISQNRGDLMRVLKEE